MKTREIIEHLATIEKFSHDGRGIARIDGKTTFIQGALPNEEVRFKYFRRKKDFDEGVMTQVIQPSPQRMEPQCAHFSRCGGCALQHLNPADQIQEKQSLFLNMLERIGHCRPDALLPPLQGPLWHYRNKARLSVRYHEKSDHVFLGFREKNSPRFIADLNHCAILTARVGTQLQDLREVIASLDNPQSIAQVEVAAGDEDIALIFRNLDALSIHDENKLIAFAQQTDFRIFLQPSGPQSVYLLFPKEAGEFLTYRLPSEDITFQFHPTDFTQINSGLNRLMVRQAIELLALTPDDTVLDLFCGLGNFSLPIAKQCKKVMGVEGSEMMVQRASMNATLNGICNAAFLSANLEDEGVFQLLNQHQFSKLLLDPPRAGALEIVKRIECLNPSRIVYVSCNPATLARDADILVNEKGYHMTQAGVMDMFPHTDHVESIALFEKR